MKTIAISFLMYSISLIGCSDNKTKTADPTVATTPATSTTGTENEISTGRHFTGTFSNGMKGNKISFDISKDGKKLENLLFQGNWHCDGHLESIIGGPSGSFTVDGNKVSGHVSEPPNGGATAWRYDLTTELNGNTASGTFRMNINNLGCNTGTLNFTATAK